MNILRIEGVGKQIQGQTLFDNVDLTIDQGERLGVIGVNGSGKTTLLKVIAGESEADWGKITVAGGCRVAYLSQQPVADGSLTIAQAVYQSQREALQAYEDYQELCSRLDENATEADYKKLDQLGEILEQTGFYDLQVRADTAIQHLGLAHLTGLVSNLSGGQRRRVDLAQVLTSMPDLLLLDEPTNHLDPESVDWLEGFLGQYRGAVLMITHDRYFLDRITNRTLEIDSGKVQSYQGNYAAYLEKKAEMMAQAEAAAVKRANLWRRELEWLRRGPKARATKSKSRIERAEALRPDQKVVEQKLEFQFATMRMGTKIYELENVGQNYGDHQVIENFTFNLDPGARIGLVGRNGCGKTTLMDIMAGRLQPSSGKIETGTTVRLGYLDQETRALDPNLKVLESLQEVAGSIPLNNGKVITAAQMLERFLFSGRLQHTLVGKLSGGERRRLYLLQILISNPNVLFLDEPTNDLDIPTLSCLEDYLDSFGGCLVVSSHDRYFLDRTTEGLLCFEEGNTTPRSFTGSYTDYLESRGKLVGTR